jgi:glycosyltransferase involved in cell wall biosynthesis
VVNGTCDWFPLRVLPALGVEVVPTVHCVLWRKGERLRGVRKLIATLDRKFFARSVAALMSASHEITTQISKVAGGRARPVHEFLPSYRREQFAGLGEPPPQRKPFRVLFAGRIEREKGVFDLLEIAKAFGAAGRTEVEFDLCGTGGVLEELKAAVAAAGLGGRFRCHGHRDKATMREMFARCHAVIVPTTTQFIEGFNQVVAEGVLSGRPVITSSVCPALEYVREAVVEAPPDDVGAYGAAILRLCDDLNYYRSKVAGCRAAQGQFYDPERSWGTALRNVLRSAGLIAHARPAAWAATAVTAAKPSSSPSL